MWKKKGLVRGVASNNECDFVTVQEQSNTHQEKANTQMVGGFNVWVTRGKNPCSRLKRGNQKDRTVEEMGDEMADTTRY